MELSINPEKQSRNFIWRQARDIVKGGIPVLVKKLHIFYLVLCKLSRRLFEMPFVLLAAPAVLIARFLSPFILIRFGVLFGSRIGHFAANTELYLCERDIDQNKKRVFDILYCLKPVCNQYMWKMWIRTFRKLSYRLYVSRNPFRHILPIRDDRHAYGPAIPFEKRVREIPSWRP